MGDSRHVVGFSSSIKEDLSNARLYELVNNYLSKGYAVIYAAEPIVSSPAVGEEEEVGDTIGEQNGQEKTYAILGNLAIHIGSSKVKRYVQRGLLTITDPDSILPADASIKRLLNSMNSHVEHCEARAPQDIEGKVLFNSPSNFFQADKIDKFLEFERTLGTRFDDDNFRMICWYKKRWIQKLSFSHLVHLLAAHNQSIHKNSQFQTWDIDRTIEVISEGINKALEQDRAAEIIFETMQRRFNLDRSAIMSSPNLFADTLKMMSPDSALSIIDAIKADFENRISFANNNNHRETTRNSALQKRKGKRPQRRNTRMRSKGNNNNNTANNTRTNNRRETSK
jgi:hypothetical protein